MQRSSPHAKTSSAASAFPLALACGIGLAVSAAAASALAMGLVTLLVLITAAALFSKLDRLLPKSVLFPCHLLILAGLTSILSLLLAAFLPGVFTKLNLYLPLTIVNCLLLRQTAAVPNLPQQTVAGAAFTLALLLLGVLREALGAGTLFGWQPLPFFTGIPLFLLPPGGFLLLALLLAVDRLRRRKKAAAPSAQKTPSVDRKEEIA